MEQVGIRDPKLLQRLLNAGTVLPETGLPERAPAPEEDAVTSYHLKRLLDARDFLLEFLNNKT